MVDTPTRSKIEGWATDYLERAVTAWNQRADLVEQNFEKAQSLLSGLPWSGAGSDQARDKLFQDVVEMRRAEDALRKAADVARTGAERVRAAKQAALGAIRNAESQFFAVGEDLRVTDRLPRIVRPFLWLRQLFALVLESDIRAKAMQLAATDEDLAASLRRVSDELRDLNFGGPGSTPDNPRPGEPTITGPAGPLKYEQDKYDLQVGFPDGKGPTFGGDPQTHDKDWNHVPVVPRDPDSEKARDPEHPNRRPIPTGTAIGPNGERYAFFSYPPNGDAPPGTNPYSSPAKAWDFSDPDNPKPLGPLQYLGPNGQKSDIYQPSGAYDKKTGRMLVVGNTTNGDGKIERVLFQSDPIKPGDPPGQWTQSLHSAGTIQGLPGARENQLVALEGGGFALVGSDNANDPSRHAVSAVTAASAEALTTAVPTVIVEGANSPHGPVAPYGPSVIGTIYDPVTGQEVLDIRLSTWEGVNKLGPNGEPPAERPYDPKTFTTTITVQH